MPSVRSGEVDIYYERHGEGPAIMFVHGSGGHHMAWWRQVAYFRQWYTVLTIDLRGFGNSSAVEGGPDSLDFVLDIEAVLDEAKVGPCAILGQSIGAAPALRLAVRRPELVSAVILAHSLGGINDPELKALAACQPRRSRENPGHRSAHLPFDQGLSAGLRPGTRTFLFRQMGTFNHATMQDLRNLSAAGPSVDEVVASGVKICFVSGENDAVLWTSTVRRAHEKVPGSTLSVVPQGPHSLYWEMPQVFNAVVHQQLKLIYPDAA